MWLRSCGLLFALIILSSAVIITQVRAQSYPFDASLYNVESLKLDLNMQSNVTLIGPGIGDSLEATVNYIPEDAGTIYPNPAAESTNPLIFRWNNVRAGNYPFEYETTLLTTVQEPNITQKIAYPFQTPNELTEYLQPQEITNTDDAIRAKTNELIRGKTDSLDVVFTLATWVEANVEYNLTSVTSQASKQSTWVYDNRYGVCDELSNLFISMSREAGIPARFVSGIAYTNLDEFPDHWGPHGWAEVWLPNIGWVPVDVTYGQIGFIDATHIAISKTLDSVSSAVNYELYAHDLTMQIGDLSTNTIIVSKRGEAEESATVQLKALYDNVGSNSGNLITATIENTGNKYTALDTYLATTNDTIIIDKQRQQVLIPPGEKRILSWRVQMPKFDNGFKYTVPFSVIVQRVGTTTTEVSGMTSYPVYPVPPEESAAIGTLAIDCDKPGTLYPGEKTTIVCSAPGAKLCATSISCLYDSIKIPFTANITGAYPVVVNATKKDEAGSAVVTFIVENKPKPSISAAMPTNASFKDILTLQIGVTTASITNATVTVSGNHFEHVWNETLLEQANYELRIPATYLDAGTNEITIAVNGNDKNGAAVEAKTSIPIELEVNTWERIELLIMHLFSTS